MTRKRSTDLLNDPNLYRGTGFTASEREVPWLDTQQMIEVDRAMIEDFRIDLVRMMENAGRALAILARDRFLNGSADGKRVCVLAGSGGNGGGAMVCARRLANWGAEVDIYLTREKDEVKAVPAQQLDILDRMRQSINPPSSPGVLPNNRSVDLVVDGVIGYSLSGSPHGAAAELICWANDQEAPVLSLDTPSGLDTATGKAFNPAVRATATMTLALPKEGLRSNPEHVGELYLADISVPPELYEQSLGFNVGPLFATSDIVKLSPTCGSSK